MSDPSQRLSSGGAGQHGGDRPLTILFSEGSSISARQALYDLSPRHTIDVLDPDPLCQCRFSSLVRRWYRCPPYTTDPIGYLKFLAARLASEQYDVLLPLHDEIFLLARVREELARRVGVAIADFDTVATLQSKLKFRELAAELGFDIPKTHVVSQSSEIADWSDYPIYAKLDFGTAGQTVRLVTDRKQLEAALTDFAARGWHRHGEPFLLQRPATGDQSVVRAIFRRGQMVGAHASRLLVRGVGGAATVREGVHHPTVLEHVRRFGERLAWHGALFGDYFYDPATERAEFIEFNPRIGDSANASYSGLNLIQRWADVAAGRDLDPTPTPNAGISTHASMLILMSKAMEGASRGELWQEIGRQRRGEGLYATSNEELTRPRVDRLSRLPYIWVAGRLLASPASAQKMVHATVKNYALSADAAERIRNIPQAELAACFT